MTDSEPRRTLYEANACVLLRRDGRWLLGVRSAAAAYAPGQLGLIGGHVEPVAGADVLENTVRREVAEETGLDLVGVALHYLTSELYRGPSGRPVLTVTYAAELPGDAAVTVADAEHQSVGWWSADALAADPRCSPWVPGLVDRAGRLLDGLRTR